MSDSSSASGGFLTGIFGWLGRQIDQLVLFPPKTRPIAPFSLTDEQIHAAICRVRVELLRLQRLARNSSLLDVDEYR
jgi:hypothetical protein